MLGYRGARWNWSSSDTNRTGDTIITSIITALSIGIGVDYTIHMIHRYREEYSLVRDPEKAATRTLATTGSELLGSALTTALGLGVLVASPLAASQQFGITARSPTR